MNDPARLPRSGWLALGAVSGAVLGDAGGGPVSVAAALAGLLLAGSIAGLRLGRSRAGSAGAGAVRAGLFLAIGALMMFGRTALMTNQATVALQARPDPTGLAGAGGHTATVDSVGSPKAAEQIALIELDDPGAASGSPVEALLPRYPEIGPGDRIAVSGGVRAPGDDDFGGYLRRIGAAGSLRSPILVRLSGPAGVVGLLDGIREGSAAALARALPEPQAGLASGILVGLRERVDRELAAAFTTAGVSHIVAISGWNIAIVAALVGALLGRAGARTRTIVTLSAIVAYALVAGASPSVNRAAVMAGIGLTARANGRSGPALGALGWAIAALLLIDPGTVADPGFELSGLATAGLIAWSAPLAGRLGRVRFEGTGPPAWLAESLAISIAAEAATLPVVLATFGRLALVAPLANLVIVPLVPVAMAAGAVALAAGWLGGIGLPQLVVTVLGLPAWAALGAMIWLVRFAAQLPFASVTLPPPWNLAGAGLAAAIVLGSVAAGHLLGRGGVPSGRSG